ncbi:Alpha/Beta hydrolase protein [Dactylonectria estremocensis]|uniref:Alpha/Beta hydrolase protein n=1 Tax=Dactylonectria estremocensis TaxID=1079267 RepID=A0A9P9IIE8_9HYPO|nr:Alpha/Beta hydrolase protein [Dactylonectria estremocensis]
MTSSLLTGLDGYKSQTLTYKSTRDGDIKVDVAYPEATEADSSTVLLHYHGGFLVFGDRFSFLPRWLLNAATSRKWIYVTPDYRLIPETTAQSSLEDAIDAYEWVLNSLPEILGRRIGSVLMAGSSAGGFLALTTAASVSEPPRAVLSIYGMLDAANSRYTTAGTNIFGRPAIETASILADFPQTKDGDGRQVLSAYPLDPANAPTDPRLTLVSALHVDALYPDYFTGVEGLARALAKEGVDAIPQEHRNLFPLAFGDLKKLPRTMLIHGKTDSAVPVELSIQAAEKLRAAGVEVFTEFPDDAEHGFDGQLGNVDLEKTADDGVASTRGLRNAIRFLQDSA